MTVTIKDVAKEANVSITTVSMVLNNSNYKIRQDTKEKVVEAAKRLNYTPNEIARSLVMKKTNTIALVVPDIMNPFYPELAKSVSSASGERGYNVILINSMNYKEETNNEFDLWGNGLIDGVLIAERDEKFLELLHNKNKKLKTVYLDEPEFNGIEPEYLVSGDNFHGGYLAGKHLMDKGHEKIACVTGVENSVNSMRRFSGFSRACFENGIRIKPENVLTGNYSFEGGYDCGRILAQKDITAIFCFNDLSAYGVIKALREESIRIPEDIAIMGYDNLFMTKFIEPSITTIDQRLYKIGRVATNILLDLIEGKKDVEKKVLVNPKLVERETTLVRKY